MEGKYLCAVGVGQLCLEIADGRLMQYVERQGPPAPTDSIMEYKGRVNLEHLVRMERIAEQLDVHRIWEAPFSLPVLSTIAQPSWFEGLQQPLDYDPVSMVVTYQGTATAITQGALRELVATIDGYYELMEAGVAATSLADWAKGANLRCNLALAQAGICQRRLLHDQSLASHGLYSDDDWTAQAATLGLIENRAAAQLERLLNEHPVADGLDADDVEPIKQAAVQRAASDTYWYARNERDRRKVGYCAFSCLLPSLCALRGQCECSEHYDWLITEGPGVLGVEVIDHTRFRDSLSELYDHYSGI